MDEIVAGGFDVRNAVIAKNLTTGRHVLVHLVVRVPGDDERDMDALKSAMVALVADRDARVADDASEATLEPVFGEVA